MNNFFIYLEIRQLTQCVQVCAFIGERSIIESLGLWCMLLLQAKQILIQNSNNIEAPNLAILVFPRA